jgi:hypothetical protein
MGVRLHRTAVIDRGKNKEAIAFAAAVSDYLGDKHGLDIAWGLEVGGTVGKVHWYVDYENMAALETTLTQTMDDAGYQGLVDSVNDVFVGNATDTLVYTM